MPTYDPSRLPGLFAAEERRFVEAHPRSRELFERARGSLLGGVPMHWMLKWAGGFPLFVHEAHGARFVDVDGIEYVDLCLGDTGAMIASTCASARSKSRLISDRTFCART